MKHKTCPKCGSSDLGDRWCTGRKLQQFCKNDDEDCNWKGDLRIPERIKITDTKDLRVDNFCGWDYIIYDKYGHVSVYSRTYNSKDKALKELEYDITVKNENDPVSPYTGVLFKTPPTIKIRGEMFKMKDNKCIKIN